MFWNPFMKEEFYLIPKVQSFRVALFFNSSGMLWGVPNAKWSTKFSHVPLSPDSKRRQLFQQSLLDAMLGWFVPQEWDRSSLSVQCRLVNIHHKHISTTQVCLWPVFYIFVYFCISHNYAIRKPQACSIYHRNVLYKYTYYPTALRRKWSSHCICPIQQEQGQALHTRGRLPLKLRKIMLKIRLVVKIDNHIFNESWCGSLRPTQYHPTRR